MKRLERLFRSFEDDFDSVFESYYNFKSDPNERNKRKLIEKIKVLNRSKAQFTNRVKDFTFIKKEPII